VGTGSARQLFLKKKKAETKEKQKEEQNPTKIVHLPEVSFTRLANSTAFLLTTLVLASFFDQKTFLQSSDLSQGQKVIR
jgi:hypothetical protein